MKITIEPETPKEKEDFKEALTLEGLYEFGLVGTLFSGDAFVKVRRMHGQPLNLIGELYAGIEYAREYMNRGT